MNKNIPKSSKYFLHILIKLIIAYRVVQFTCLYRYAYQDLDGNVEPRPQKTHGFTHRLPLEYQPIGYLSQLGSNWDRLTLNIHFLCKDVKAKSTADSHFSIRCTAANIIRNSYTSLNSSVMLLWEVYYINKLQWDKTNEK